MTEIEYKTPRVLYQGTRKVLVTGDYVGHGPDDPSGYYYHYEGETVRHWISARAISVRFTTEPSPPLASSRRRELVVEAAANGVKQCMALFGAVSVVPTDKGFCVVFDNDERMYFDALEM